jgi:hypothetical protein
MPLIRAPGIGVPVSAVAAGEDVRGVRVGVVTIGLQGRASGAWTGRGWVRTLVDGWGSGETRIAQENLPGLGTLPTSRR